MEKITATAPAANVGMSYDEKKAAGHYAGRNYGGEKETVTHKSVICIVDGKAVEPITYRAYMGRSKGVSTVYATIWVHPGECHRSGSGSAGGYGYHKESAAAYDAAISCGFTFSKCLSGTGQIDQMLAAMALALGYENPAIFGFG